MSYEIYPIPLQKFIILVMYCHFFYVAKNRCNVFKINTIHIKQNTLNFLQI